MTFVEYYNSVMARRALWPPRDFRPCVHARNAATQMFARALLAVGLPECGVINIIGCNSPGTCDGVVL